MPLKWFRRRARQEQAPTDDTPAAPPAPHAAPEPETQPVATEGEQPRPRRKRGSRGGRGRKRKTPAAQAEPQAEEQPAQPPEEKPRQRRRSGSRTDSRRKQPTRRAPLPAAKRELLVSVDVTEQAVAVLEDDRVAEVYLERPGRRSIAGNVYKGVVDNVLPGMEAAFVEIGLEKNGFLYVDEIVGPELEGKRHGRRIQDLLARGQEILVQAVKDPMKSKGARLTTEISLPGRFVVYVPQGEGIGVSRRLEDDERTRLKDILRAIQLPKGGLIVRTAAEGASPEDIERDVRFLEKLWKEIQAKAKQSSAPSLVYSEAELPLRVVRDLFTDDFERALVDDDRTHRRITGYLKKTSPHMAERVIRYRDKPPLFEAHGVDAEIRSTLNKRVDLPSGGYLVFDYAEAFTVIDVNTGRFVGSRSRTSTARLEETVTKNNVEAAKEVVRQLRLRDIGGIIVIDFVDMANPKNRATVEDALKRELERDRTKTYVVEISPLGLVEMTRQNVTEGPREILTRRCPTCEGNGTILSEASAVVDAERRLRALASQSPRTKAFRVELNARVRDLLVGPGAAQLAAIEDVTKRRFFLERKADAPLDHFAVLEKGPLAKLQPKTPVEEGQELELKLVEVGLYDAESGVGKLDGLEVAVAGAAKLVGKKVRARVERVLDGTAFATLVGAPEAQAAPISAEGLAEKPTRASRSRRVAEQPAAEPAEDVVEVVAEDARGEEAVAEEAPKKKRTRRGSRGGRNRRKKPAAAADAAAEAAAENGEPAAAPKIHMPAADLGAEAPADGDNGEQPSEQAETPKKKRTRRGSRGGRRRRKPAAAVTAEPTEPAPE
ncbi:MAG TPA: Rne/Rng family ribonuclease [Gaiellaceae bacterium]|nr:Rne/Rng family ribonuclease [Gaiellaceae bacterium]